jgi:hypothetical protein
MTVLSVLCIWVWLSLEAMMGWPIDRVPTGKYDIAWVEIEEPNKSKNIKGGIYIWIRNMDQDADLDLFNQEDAHKDEREPRAYGVPYSREMHKEMNKVKGMLKAGGKVRAEIKKGEKGEKGSIKQEPDIQLHILPPPKPPKMPIPITSLRIELRMKE